MQTVRSKRSRVEESNPGVLRAWWRMTMKFMMLVGHTMQHRVLQHLQVPGPRGMMYRQIIQGAELLTIEELDRLVGALGSRLEERSLRAVAPETKTRGPSPGQSSTGSWAKVSTASENAEPSMTRSVLATMWELPQDLDYNREAPECDCGEKCRIHVSKTSQNWDRLFWRCPKSRRSSARSSCSWIASQPGRPARARAVPTARMAILLNNNGTVLIYGSPGPAPTTSWRWRHARIAAAS